VFQEAPERSSGGIIHLADSGSLAVFFLQLHYRLEEVHIAFYQGIEPIQLLQGPWGMVAVVADESTDHGPVFLLDVGVVVLPVGSGPGAGDALLLAVGVEVVVDELAAVVGVDTQEGEGKFLADVMDGATHSLLTLTQHAPAGHSAGGDVHGAEGVEVLAFGGFPAVSYQVYFQESTSRKPGWCSFHSAKVRMGMAALSREPGLVVEKGLLCSGWRWGRSKRSMVAALMEHTWSFTSCSRMSSP